MPRVVTRKDSELLAVLRPQLVAAYTDELLAKGLDRGSAKRIAARRFENELANGQVLTATRDEIVTEKKKRFYPSEFFRRARTALALKLIAPKSGAE